MEAAKAEQARLQAEKDAYDAVTRANAIACRDAMIGVGGLFTGLGSPGGYIGAGLGALVGGAIAADTIPACSNPH